MARTRTKRTAGKTLPGKAINTKTPRKGLSRGRKSIVPARRRRFKPGSKLISILISMKLTACEAVALREIRRYQKTTELLIKKAPFARLVKEIMNNVTVGGSYRIQSQALLALQEASEQLLVNELTSMMLRTSTLY